MTENGDSVSGGNSYSEPTSLLAQFGDDVPHFEI
jgi:hypothetical protein